MKKMLARKEETKRQRSPRSRSSRWNWIRKETDLEDSLEQF